MEDTDPQEIECHQGHAQPHSSHPRPLSQVCTQDQHSILRQAARILGIGLEELPNALQDVFMSSNDLTRTVTSKNLFTTTTETGRNLPDVENIPAVNKTIGQIAPRFGVIPNSLDQQTVEISSYQSVGAFMPDTGPALNVADPASLDVFGTGLGSHDRSTARSLDILTSGDERLHYGFGTALGDFSANDVNYTSVAHQPAPIFDTGNATSIFIEYDTIDDDIGVNQIAALPGLGSPGARTSGSNRPSHQGFPHGLSPTHSLANHEAVFGSEIVQSSSASSAYILTPASSGNYVPTGIRPQPMPVVEGSRSDITDPELRLPQGFCSKVWHLPKTGRQRRKGNGKNKPQETRKAGSRVNKTSGNRRRPFQDERKKEGTALTRHLIACIRCRMQKLRCEADPDNQHGSCLTCIQLSKPTLSRLPCLRYKITDASLFRDQPSPNPFFAKRWKTMEMVNITDWASPECKTIEITHGFGNARCSLRVRQFVPVESDVLADMWEDGGVLKRHEIPPYAIANMEEAADAIRGYVDTGVASFLMGVLQNSETFYWNTYLMAFKHSQNAPTDIEKMLLTNALRLWAVARVASTVEEICGDVKLGSVVEDPTSPSWGKVPIPPIIGAQLEIIGSVRMQRPWMKKVLDSLQTLIKANDKRYWFTIYLTLFIILHSCTMTTQMDARYAKTMSLETHFANPRCIAEQHVGVLTMLAHFHYCNKGSHPFTMAEDPIKLQELAEAAKLGIEQVQFIQGTSQWVKQKRQDMQLVKENRNLEDDLYFLSQLFEENWEPCPTAEIHL